MVTWKFYGRNEQLAALGEILQRGRWFFAKVTGRRRIGKTTLIQGIAAGLEVKDYVTSPSFIIINEYQGRLPFFHVDLYRLEETAAIEDLGIEEYFKRGGVCVIEWAERLKNLLPLQANKIELDYLSENERRLTLSPELADRI